MNIFYKSKIILGLESIRPTNSGLSNIIFNNFRDLVYSHRSNTNMYTFNTLLNNFLQSYNKGSLNIELYGNNETQYSYIQRNNQGLFDTLIMNFNSINFTDEDTPILKQFAMFFNNHIESNIESVINDMRTLISNIIRITAETNEMNQHQNEALSQIKELCENMNKKIE
jgi:hypothetical protein